MSSELKSFVYIFALVYMQSIVLMLIQSTYILQGVLTRYLPELKEDTKERLTKALNIAFKGMTIVGLPTMLTLLLLTTLAGGVYEKTDMIRMLLILVEHWGLLTLVPLITIRLYDVHETNKKMPKFRALVKALGTTLKSNYDGDFARRFNIASVFGVLYLTQLAVLYAINYVILLKYGGSL